MRAVALIWALCAAVPHQSPAGVAPDIVLADWVEHVADMGIVGGCGGGNYCPDASISRAQMTVFLLRALEGEGYLPPACQEGAEMFADVPADHLFCPWIEETANRGISGGCGGGNFCPGDSVSRGRMTVFLLRTFEGAGYTPPACLEGMEAFGDVAAGNLFCAWIEDLRDRGVVFGCGGGNFCPGDPWTRGQMAVFLLKMLGVVPDPCTGQFADVPCYVFWDRFQTP